MLLTIDWIMRRLHVGQPRGIQWTLVNRVEELDLADDLALLPAIYVHLQENKPQSELSGKAAGLSISKEEDPNHVHHVHTLSPRCHSLYATHPSLWKTTLYLIIAHNLTKDFTFS